MGSALPATRRRHAALHVDPLKPEPQQFEWLGYLPLDREDMEDFNLGVGRCLPCGAVVSWAFRERHRAACKARLVTKRRVVDGYNCASKTSTQT